MTRLHRGSRYVGPKGAHRLALAEIWARYTTDGPHPAQLTEALATFRTLPPTAVEELIEAWRTRPKADQELLMKRHRQLIETQHAEQLRHDNVVIHQPGGGTFPRDAVTRTATPRGDRPTLTEADIARLRAEAHASIEKTREARRRRTAELRDRLDQAFALRKERARWHGWERRFEQFSEECAQKFGRRRSIPWDRRLYEAEVSQLRSRHRTRCEVCDVDTDAFDVDHIWPLQFDPPWNLGRANLQTLCRPCHHRKTNLQRYGAQFGWRFVFERGRLDVVAWLPLDQPESERP